MNKALGTEYSLTGNQIQGYRELADQIDTVIAKKKAEALLDQYMSMNSAMLKQNAAAQQGYENYRSQYKEAKAAETEAMRNFRKTVQDMDISPEDYMWVYNNVGQGTKQGYEAAKAYAEAKETTKNTAQLMQEEKALFDETLDYIHKLDDAERAFSEERYDDVKEILYSEQNVNKQILEDTKSSLEEREEAYKKSLEKIYSDIKLYSDKWRQKEADAIMQEMKEVIEAGKLAGISVDKAFTKEFKESIQKMLDAGFDISELAKWAKDSGIDIGDVFDENYTKIVQKQLDEGYSIYDLLQWGANSGVDVGTIFTDEFKKKYEGQLNEGFDITGFVTWAAEKGKDIGDVFGESFRDAYTQYIYAANNLVDKYSINSESDARYWREHWRDTAESEEYFRNLGWHGAGGFIPTNSSGIVAEAGPELLEVMNGGVRVTNLTPSGTNSAIGAGKGTTINNYYNSVKAVVASKYDVYEMAEDLDTAERRINQGKGM